MIHEVSTCTICRVDGDRGIQQLEQVGLVKEKRDVDSSVFPLLFCAIPMLHEYISTGHITITFPSISIVPK